MRLTLLALVLALLTGCAPSLTALGKDKASGCFYATTIYGTSTLVRIGEGQTVAFGEKCQAVSKP